MKGIFTNSENGQKEEICEKEKRTSLLLASSFYPCGIYFGQKLEIITKLYNFSIKTLAFI